MRLARYARRRVEVVAALLTRLAVYGGCAMPLCGGTEWSWWRTGHGGISEEADLPLAAGCLRLWSWRGRLG